MSRAIDRRFLRSAHSPPEPTFSCQYDTAAEILSIENVNKKDAFRAGVKQNAVE